MATTLQVNLSQQMQDWLSDGGSAYAILDGGTSPGGSATAPLASQTLVSSGVAQSGGAFTIDLTTTSQPNLSGAVGMHAGARQARNIPPPSTSTTVPLT